MRPACALPLLLLPLLGVDGASVSLSNTALPTDQFGQKLITGEADLVEHEGAFYLYFNNWGPCPGINCCQDPRGCATCCFMNPPAGQPWGSGYLPGCGRGNTSGSTSLLVNSSDPYGNYHTIQGYKTTDFKTFENLGVVLPLAARDPGCEFRPHVVYNAKTKMFVMWFEDRPLKGYTVAQAPSPGGPFKVTHNNVLLPGKGRTGDYDVFVDDDGTAYNVRTGFDVVKLNDAYTGAAASGAVMSSFSTPKASEGPVVFKRGKTYYVLAGTGCCACIGGSTIYVMMAPSLNGPWTYAGDVGSNPTPFDKHSPHNYVTKAQASFVFKTSGGEYIWCGNQWNSGLAETPPGPRQHDLLYWTSLQFNKNGTVQQVVYDEQCTFNI